MASLQGRARCRRIFSALDGRDFIGADCRWRLNVFSVIQEATGLWLQLGLAGNSLILLTIRLAQNADTRQVLEALADQFGQPPLSLGVSNVA